MPEGRMLKKRISESKKLGSLKSDSARLLYTWLLPHLDVEGLFSADPDIIKGYIFPKIKTMTTNKIKKLIYELASVELIIIYAENGEQFLKLNKFHEFQKIDPKKEGKSTYPQPTKDNILKINEKQDYSGITLKNSRVTLKNSSTSKVKESKVKVKEKYSSQFETFWNSWPSERRQKKSYTENKFNALCKKGLLDKFRIACQNYADYLEYQRQENNFDQTPMLTSTFMNNWEEWAERKGYEGARL